MPPNLVQQVLEKVERATSNRAANNPQGRFRSWRTTVARHSAIDAIRRIRPDTAQGGTSILEQLHTIPDRDDEFTETTWAAFWETMVNGVSCDQVAEQLERSQGAIYTARSRVMERLKQELEHFHRQEAHDHAPEEST
jgi:DNA-directed RNA polymerase specialized sigma24 family protein